MSTGCPQCDEIQAKTGSKSAICLSCEMGYQDWIIACARKRRKEISEAMQKLELGIESEVQNVSESK